jgi:hypothetical protein
MSFTKDLAALFNRDLSRLNQQIEAFPDDETLWRTLPGITNSAANLALHIEGNLKEYIGRQYGHLNWHLGQIDYVRRIVTGSGALQRTGL